MKKQYRELPLSNDFIFGEVMRRPDICKLFLESLLGREIERIEYISKQQDLSESGASHGIRLDIYLKDSKNKVYAVEMQTTSRRKVQMRVRYYQGMIDRHNLEKGMSYADLPESYIIMVCTWDIFCRGQPVYRRKLTLHGCEDIEYDDGTHLYFLNAAYEKAGAPVAVMEFLRCIRENDVNEADYKTELMKKICPVMAELRNDPGKEAEYMMWEAKVMDIRYDERENGIQILIRALQKIPLDRETVVETVAREYGLSEEEAEEKVAEYWTE